MQPTFGYVFRNSKYDKISASKLVPGDILKIK